ncbi:unnamed protein product [Hymenolepis diminuta]|uniref:Uncharacterized protein n=1 Tax=Hymenolepis diminuta TaxID=6216 RepID=A0A564Z223_HYMDI|nr:unnamed protein product [Hymenolepis diminuta]
MANTAITNEMKGHSVIVTIKATHNNLEIVRFPKVTTSFVCKIRKELLNENNGDELATMRKKKEHCQRSADSLLQLLTQNT